LQAVIKEACDYAITDIGLDFSTFKRDADETEIPKKFLVETGGCIHSLTRTRLAM